MLMCRSPFQGLLFIYTSQSQPPRCQTRTLAWHAQPGGGAGRGCEGEGGAGGATLANRTRPWRGGGVFSLVNKSGVKLETSFGRGRAAGSPDRLPPPSSPPSSNASSFWILPSSIHSSGGGPFISPFLLQLLPPPSSPPSSSRASLMATMLISLCAYVT